MSANNSISSSKSGQKGAQTNGQSMSSTVVKWFSHIKYEHMLAGVSGGVASTLVLHPLDLLKVRLAGNVNTVRHFAPK